MVKALVFSDSHGSISSVEAAARAEKDFSLIIFAGDIQSDAEAIVKAYPRIPVAYVLGNNDWFVKGVPYDRRFTFGGKKFFLTHGHKYGVKSGLLQLSMKARETEADICVFGHTHVPLLEFQNGIYFINPGTAWRTYAVISISDGGKVNAEIKNIP